MKKAKYYLYALIIIGSVGKLFIPWYNNVNFQGFNDIIAETGMIYANCLENVRVI